MQGKVKVTLMFTRNTIMKPANEYPEQINKLKWTIKEAEVIVIGAGAGLSASVGLSYTGERFQKNCAEFIAKYHYQDMYSATFYPYKTREEYWAYMSHHIYMNRYSQPAKKTHLELLKIVTDKDYFVITTNVDHLFQKSGIDKQRLFYTQGDYGLWQCSVACHEQTYDNENIVHRMLNEQEDLRIPTELIPHCPKCGKSMTMNLRCDHTFVQDNGWHMAAKRYEDFIRKHQGYKILYLELGVGGNTPVIIKYPFWQMTAKNPNATYACINLGESVCPGEIEKSSICIDADIDEVINSLA